jgi:hypothetical protein
MAAISNQPEPQNLMARLGFTWEGVAEHRPVTGLTVWLLKLAAISSALILFVAAVIIGISVTDPTSIGPQSGPMHFANMAMSFGTDGALPGIFFMAVESWQQERRARSSWLFLLVTAMLTTAFVGYCVAGQTYEANFAHPLLVAKCTVSLVYVMSVAHQVKQNGLNVIQVATLEQRMQEMVAQIQATGSQTVSDLKTSISAQVASEVAKISTAMSAQVAQNLATLHDSVAAEVAQTTATIGEGVAAQIAQLQYRLDDENALRTLSGDQDTALLSEQIGQLVSLVNDQTQIIQHFTNELAGVRREVHTTVTEIRSFAQETPAQPVAAPTIVDASSEPGERVRAFLQQWSSPKRPTIQVIMDSCQVAKKTATRYRDEFYGVATSSHNEDEE